ncbi:MAG: glycosyltransferase [Deltaproteobacteria bacterium]|nr:glycosyltransferase [Deltaproteobacteria bacterium]
MKVLMIAPEPFFTPRGTPFSIRSRIQALLALDHSVDLVTYHIGDDISLPGLHIYRTPWIAWIRSVVIGPSLTKIFLDILLFGLALARVVRQRYDVIHTHEEAGLIGTILAPIAKAQHLYDMHSSLPQQLANFKAYNYGPIVKFLEALERFVVRRADAVITICPELSERVAAIDKARPCFLIENSI